MKRILVMDSTSIVELFDDWVRATGRKAFWLYDEDLDGREMVALLPSLAGAEDAMFDFENPDEVRQPNPNKPGTFEINLITEPGRNDVYLVVGHELHGAESTETRVGSLDDEPGLLLERSKVWLLDMAKEYKDLMLGMSAVFLATASKNIALCLDDEKTALECVDLIAEVNG